MIEVAGADTAMVNAVGNTMANAWGLLVPIVAVYSKRRWGTYLPLFIQATVLNGIGAALFARYCRLNSKAEAEAEAAAEAKRRERTAAK